MYSGRREFCLVLSPTPTWGKKWILTAHSYRLFQTTLTYVKPILYYIYGVGNGNPPQYSCLGNSMDRGPWLATVHGVAKSRIQLSTQTRIQHLVLYLVIVNNLYSSFSSLSPPLFLFFFLVVLSCLQDLSSPTRDWTQAKAVKAQSPNHEANREFPLLLKYIYTGTSLFTLTWRYWLINNHYFPVTVMIFFSFQSFLRELCFSHC